MPSYEFRCRACGTTFTVRRPMHDSSAPASCPHGHDDTVRLLTTLGLGGLSQGGPTGQPSAAPAGGCCGGGCGCG